MIVVKIGKSSGRKCLVKVDQQWMIWSKSYDVVELTLRSRVINGSKVQVKVLGRVNQWRKVRIHFWVRQIDVNWGLQSAASCIQ